MSKDTSWIVKGAKVVRITGLLGNEGLSWAHDEVSKVNKRTFALTNVDDKVSLDSLMEDNSHPWAIRFEVVRPDDPRVELVKKKIVYNNARSNLRKVSDDAWKNTTRETLDALREAVNQVDQAIERLRLAQEKVDDAKAGA